ncbi:MAG: DJ-1/PfpI family protein [Crocinitomicaceae bacterium]|nr:DJ-1/PfpI family protein [Crocinitomicaceae bacterium]
MKYYLFLSAILILSACNETEPHESANSEQAVLNPDNYNVAFLIMDGTFNTELTAPYDIYQHTIFRDSIKAMNVFTVANTSEAITTFEGMRILPDFNYMSDKLPRIDILVVPSAEHHLDSDLEDENMLSFIRMTSWNALFVTSHCDGAFVLAKAGILDGIVSTTFPGDIEAMREMFPSLDIRDSTLFVHDGKFITSAGGAKSFEASLYLCELLYGKKYADQLAEGMVIDWDLNTTPHTVVE